MGKILEKIIKFSIYSLVFLVPLFLLPFSFEIYEFSKQYLIFFLVSIGFIAWLSKMIFIDKEIRFRKTPLNIFVLLFLFISIISAFFSIDKNFSLFGFYGRFSNGLIGLLLMGLFYFLITNNSKTKNQRSEGVEEGSSQEGNIVLLIESHSLINVFLWSVFFTTLITYFSIFGLWQKIPISLPLFMLQKTFNPVSGSLEGLSIFFSVIITLLTGKIIIGSKGEKKANSKFLPILLIAMIVLMAIIDFNPSWLVLAISLILFLIFALTTRVFKQDVNRLLLPIILILISVIFLFIGDISQWTGIALAREQVLEQSISWQTAFKGITSSFQNFFLGSGIGTWSYDFSKFKPNEFNNTTWWQVRFDRAGSYASELLATLGVLGFISYSLIIIMFFLVFWVLREKKELFPYIMTFTALVITHFVYYQDTVLSFTFWLILGLSVIAWQHTGKSFKVISFKDFPELSLVFSTVLVLLLLVFSVSSYFAVKFYLADINYAKSQSTFVLDEKIRLIEEAVRLNPKLATYQTVLARVYAVSLLDEIKKPADQQDATKVQNYMVNSIDWAKKAIELSPNRVFTWEGLGMIYRDFQFLIEGATDWSINSFEKAIELEDKNPIFYTEIGKLYLVLEENEKAKQSFTKAKEIKPDYIDVLIQEALIDEKEENLDVAIEKIEALATTYPFHIDVRFHLGRMYFNQGEVSKAIVQFEIILSIVPNHSNALYSLGIAYVLEERKEDAILIFEKVLELNPGNEDVIQKLSELKAEQGE
jgi:Flp pilus assembly protein TadD